MITTALSVLLFCVIATVSVKKGKNYKYYKNFNKNPFFNIAQHHVGGYN